LEHSVSPVNETTWRTEFHNNPYVQSKTESEQLAWQLAKKLDLDMVSILPGAIIGPHNINLTPTMDYLQQALNGEIFVDVNFPFTFVDARDLATGMIAAAKKGRSNHRNRTGDQPASQDATAFAKRLAANHVFRNGIYQQIHGNAAIALTQSSGVVLWCSAAQGHLQSAHRTGLQPPRSRVSDP
jgi:nucleoside-diphosphate-sugar epimerase